MESHKKLFRSADSKMIGGVAAGIAEYLGISPLIARLIFLALAIFGGSGVLLYLLLWFIVPRDPVAFTGLDDRRSGGGLVALLKSLVVAFLGAMVLVWATGIPFFISFCVGLGLGLYHFGRNSDDTMSLGERLGLYRSHDRKIMGVFGGLADRFNMDPTVMRVMGVVLLVVSSGAIIPLYLLYAFLIPKEELDTTVERIIIIG